MLVKKMSLFAIAVISGIILINFRIEILTLVSGPLNDWWGAGGEVGTWFLGVLPSMALWLYVKWLPNYSAVSFFYVRPPEGDETVTEKVWIDRKNHWSPRTDYPLFVRSEGSDFFGKFVTPNLAVLPKNPLVETYNVILVGPTRGIYRTTAVEVKTEGLSFLKEKYGSVEFERVPRFSFENLTAAPSYR